MIWKANASGSFTTGSAYEILQESPEVNARSIWSKIWKIKVPERVRVFMWRAVHKRIPTKSWTQKWDGGGGLCPMCHHCVEDVLHALREETQKKRNTNIIQTEPHNKLKQS